MGVLLQLKAEQEQVTKSHPSLHTVEWPTTVTFTLRSNLRTDYIQKRRGEPGLCDYMDWALGSDYTYWLFKYKAM